MSGENIGQAYVQIMPSAKGIKNALTKEFGGVGAEVGNSLMGNIKGAILKAGIGAALLKVVKESLSEGAKLEQSFGGLDTLYGDAAEGAKKYAYEASKAGISANDYAEQAVSFGASLKQAYGGDTLLAMKAANTAILDMADNSAKMGTPLQDIQNAYQGFAKQNYTMLDNLKLGYGGTKTEMERLLKDAQELTGVEYDIDNLGDVYDAIHAIQGNLGLTGVAAKEAETTFSGSFNAMKAAASNLFANLMIGEGVEAAMKDLVQRATVFIGGNLIPGIVRILSGLPIALITMISEIGNTVLPAVAEAAKNVITTLTDSLNGGIPAFLVAGIMQIKSFLNGISQNLPSVLSEGVNLISELINGVLQSLPGFISLAGELITSFLEFWWENLPTILEAGGELISNIVQGIQENLPQIATSAGSVIGNLLSAFVSHLPEILIAGAQLIGQLVIGIVQAIPTVVSAIVGLIGSAISSFLGGNWIGSGSQAIGKVVSGIGAAAGRVLVSLRTLASNAIRGFISGNWLSAGLQAISKILSGLTPGSIVGRMSSLARSAMNAFRNINWSSLGSNIISGIVSGIGGAAGSLFNSLTNLASSALEKAKGLLKIGSPSRVFGDEVGHWIPAGVAVGVEENTQVLNDAIERMARSGINFAKEDLSYLESPLGGNSPKPNNKVDLIITLLRMIANKNVDIYIDGEKISEATYPYMNRKLGMAL